MKQYLCVTVEEFDDVGEVHVVLQDDVPVELHQGQRDEEHEVTGRGVLRRPDRLPHREHVIIHQLWESAQLRYKIPYNWKTLYKNVQLLHNGVECLDPDDCHLQCNLKADAL